jgi:predicted ATPase/DNA-binding SARP family transcriptional activator
VEFRVLGRLEVAADGRDLTPARPKQRSLLALLFLHANEVVASDTIIDTLWGGDPPGTALTALHGHVSALRKRLGHDLIETRAPGYLLRLDPGQTDVGRFESLVEHARREREPGRRGAMFREALSLFRGDPLADLRYAPFAQAEIARLEELRLTALEERLDAELAAARHSVLVPELERLVAAHPLRDRLRGYLMLALYRAGRQVDALDVYQRGRHAVVEQLGIEPGPALQRLERQILNQDAALDLGEAEQLPGGTVTLLFTDIDGSTSLLDELGDVYADALAMHRRLLREAYARHAGSEIDTQRYAFFVAFASARDAVAAALDAQLALSNQRWPQDRTLRVRTGIHTCEAHPTGEGYVGIGVHRAARICAAGHGGQVLVSHTTSELLAEEPLDDVALRDLGPHRLKDLTQPERIFQLVAEGLDDEFPPLDTLDARPTNLPTQPTPLIGRDRELAQVRDRLWSDEVAILTLTGSGGTGKTRLALQAAADSLGRFPSGTFFVALAPVSDPELVVPTIAQVLGLRVPRGRALMQVLAEYLAERRLLLVLDNVEHVVAAAPAVAKLVAAAPGLTVLATSRQPLHVSRERVFPVPPLELPDVGADWDAVVANEAVSLFVERARAIRPDFDLTDANAPAVAAICWRLDGLPLAIELAAARVVLFPPAALLARLDERLEVLTGGARDRPARHQTLRATLDWSYDLLSEPRRRLFARLAVFAGGWTLEAAETVCNGDLDVLDGLASLIDKSLVRLEGSEEEPRFAMLETVREYALEKLRESGEEGHVRGRHLEWSITFAERSEPELRGPEQKAWLERLHAELDNFRAAFEWSRSRGDAEASLRLGSALLEFWVVRADWREGRDWIEQALADATEVDPALRMKALRSAAELADVLSDYPASTRYYDESLAIARALGNRRGIAEALRGLAFERGRVGLPIEMQRPLLEEAVEIYRELGDDPGIARSLGGIAWTEKDLRRGRKLKEEALAIHRRLGNRENVGWALLQAGVYAQYLGDFAAATPAYQEALALAEELEYTRMIARAFDRLGENALWQGELDEARRFYEQSLPLWRECGHRNGLADSLRGLGTVARLEGDGEAASSLFEESLTVCREIGYRPGEAHALLSLSALASDRAELGEAVHLHREALALWRDMDDAESVGMTVWRLGGLAALEGRFEIAARLLGASEGLREGIGAIVPPCDSHDYDRVVAEARAGLEEQTFAAAWQAGRRLELSDAAELGLVGAISREPVESDAGNKRAANV